VYDYQTNKVVICCILVSILTNYATVSHNSIRYNAAKRGLSKLSEFQVGKIGKEKQSDADKINFGTP